MGVGLEGAMHTYTQFTDMTFSSLPDVVSSMDRNPLSKTMVVTLLTRSSRSIQFAEHGAPMLGKETTKEREQITSRGLQRRFVAWARHCGFVNASRVQAEPAFCF